MFPGFASASSCSSAWPAFELAAFIRDAQPAGATAGNGQRPTAEEGIIRCDKWNGEQRNGAGDEGKTFRD